MAKPKDLQALIDLALSTQTLLTHYQSSLAPSQKAAPAAQTTKTDLPDPLDVIKATTTLLKSHTTTLSLLLITPPLTPSAISTKLNDVISGAINGMVATAAYVPKDGQPDRLGNMMRVEVKSQVRRLLSTWSNVLALVVTMAEKRKSNKDTTVTESEKQEVLSATGVVWEACDALLKLCANGIVGLVVKKAGEFRAVLLDAVDELKEWGEDVEDAEEDGDQVEYSDEEDDMFGSSNKLGKDDKELKELLDTGIKKLKMIGLLYQALIKRRLKTYSSAAGEVNATSSSSEILDDLMNLLKSIPETVDDMASAFYDLNGEEAGEKLKTCCEDASKAAVKAKCNWIGAEDEFSNWSDKWMSALESA